MRVLPRTAFVVSRLGGSAEGSLAAAASRLQHAAMGVRSVVVLAALLLAGCSPAGTTATQHPSRPAPVRRGDVHADAGEGGRECRCGSSARPGRRARVPAVGRRTGVPTRRAARRADQPARLPRGGDGPGTSALEARDLGAAGRVDDRGGRELAALIDAPPDAAPESQDRFCSQEGRPRIQYVFGYPDGSTRTVTYGYGACHVLELSARASQRPDLVAGDARPFSTTPAQAPEADHRQQRVELDQRHSMHAPARAVRRIRRA